ncbi:MAG: aminotransferase class III-fold pyridoxal phosphate-dependent enzyme [Planctomycetota bacterium]
MDTQATMAAEIDEARRIARENFELPVEHDQVHRLPGDQERNFRVMADDGQTYLLRVFVSGLSEASIRFLRDAIDHATARDASLESRLQRFLGPRGEPSPGSERMVRVTYLGQEANACLLSFLPGALLADVHPHPPELVRDIGSTLGRLASALADFGGTPPSADAEPEDPCWALLYAPAAIRARLDSLPAGERRALVERLLKRFCEVTAPKLAQLRRAVIHQDANENNLLVRVSPAQARICGLIDFGDAGPSVLVAEPAIAAAYVAFDKKDPLTAMATLVAGFHAEYPLTPVEFECLFDLALMRLCVSVAVSSERAAVAAASGETGDPYHQISARPAWAALEALGDVHPRFATAVLREAAGLAPLGPSTEAFRSWSQDQRERFAPIVGASLADAPRVDLSIDSDLVLAPPGSASLDLSLEAWGSDLEDLRRDAGAPCTVGYHDEVRLFYETEAFSEEREDGREPRTVHLGVDLFAPAGTKVFAPLNGRVLSVQRNDFTLDYGPTVIVEHEPEDGPAFATLYGHLDGEVLERLRPGTELRAGDFIGRMGAADENGGWPPHLHFQVYLDRFDEVGNLAGVASPTRRRVWTSVSPDPAGLLGLESCAASEPRTNALLDERRKRFCSSMSISYERPIQMVKGRGTRLFDAEGRAYLDAVNNVPHVGHCHPRVVAAGQRQMARLNTNTRYLSKTLHRYAEKLRARLPEHLEVIYFVSSGSEANEVAMRLAGAATNSAVDMLVQEHGYHGHTGNTVSRSHYKFAGRGGFTPPSEVHVAPIADPFRGVHLGPDSGAKYVAEVEAILERLAGEGRRPRAILAEAIIGCGGQVVPPAGYLRGAFEAVRRFGGVAIADEVQVGFGRVGTHFWAFDEQGARPDIVTMGKPIGNGHPMAAVATTREIAERFAGGMEFFATFGGNNVSAAIGEAVLDVIEDERLLENARQRGEQFFEALRPVAEQHEFIGDVRGRGLYLGVDLVKDAATREPWGEAATYVANRMRDRGILISTDGPHHNVLKIKPPIVFTEGDMRRLTETLTDTLREPALRHPA